MRESFVYRWTDHKNKMYYVGKHKGNINDGYVASSTYFLDEYYKRPNDFSRKIIRFGSDADMFEFETKLLNRVNAAFNERFYNKYNNIGNLYNDGSEEIKNSQKKTWLKNYGVDNPSKDKNVRLKMSETAKTEEVKNKKRDTLMRKYGVTHPTQSNEFIQKKKRTWKKKYGVEEVLSKDSPIRSKQDKTRIERYGSSTLMGTEHMLNKSKRTWSEKYGVDNPFKAESVKTKIKELHLSKYGVDNPAKSPEIQQKKKERLMKVANSSQEELIQYILSHYKYKKRKRNGEEAINSMITYIIKLREEDDHNVILDRLEHLYV